MDRSKALQKILESADLVGMVQDLTDPARKDSFTPQSWSGMRITLRTVRDALLDAHKSLANELVADARTATESANANVSSSRGQALRAAMNQASQKSGSPIANGATLRQSVEQSAE